jgi:hypothetical protein
MGGDTINSGDVFNELLPILRPVYMPHGTVQNHGFFGGGEASTQQKNHLRSLLRRHAGDEVAEAIRTYMNAIRLDPEARFFVSDVAPAIRYLRNLPAA